MHSRCRAEGFSRLHTACLSRYYSGTAGADPVQSRIDTNLGKAFDRDALVLLVDEELRPHLRGNAPVLLGSPGTASRDPDGTPEQPPGIEELWDTPHIYRDFKEFSEILWGQDWEDISGSAKAHGEHIYEMWLDLHVSAHDDIKDFLGHIGMELEALLDLIHSAFDKGGDALKNLLADFKQWLHDEIGISI